MTVDQFLGENPAAVCWAICYRPTGKYLSESGAYDADLDGAKAFDRPDEADAVREMISAANRNDFTVESCMQD
jgi:hypothetical protein